MIKYFHELTEEGFNQLVGLHSLTWEVCAQLYPQPKWCEYPGAVCGEMGCWSLMMFRIHNYENCNGCELQKARTLAGRLRRWLKLDFLPAIRRFLRFKLGIKLRKKANK
jgi:hypothetical protein